MKGICFKEPLFHKVVAGTKTQTRRIIFPNTDYTFWSQPSFEGMETDPTDVYVLDKDGEIKSDKWDEPVLKTIKGTYGLFEGDQFHFENSYVRPRYQPGEIVFLKEPYFAFPDNSGLLPVYRYQDPVPDFHIGTWSNKLFMPEKYARHFIKIIDVTAQKAHNITEAEAILEGCKNKAEFENWWIKIHGISSWQDNPWVWKYTFENIYEL